MMRLMVPAGQPPIPNVIEVWARRKLVGRIHRQVKLTRVYDTPDQWTASVRFENREQWKYELPEDAKHRQGIHVAERTWETKEQAAQVLCAIVGEVRKRHAS